MEKYDDEVVSGRIGRPLNERTQEIRKKVLICILTEQHDLSTIDITESAGLNAKSSKDKADVVQALRYFEKRGRVQRRTYRSSHGCPGQPPLMWGPPSRRGNEHDQR